MRRAEPSGSPTRLSVMDLEGLGRGARSWWGAALASAIVVAVGLTLQAVADDPDPRPGADAPRGAGSSVTAPAGWRVESYGGIQVRVPAGWGWGGAWFHASWDDGSVTDCGAAPFVVPGDPSYESVPQDTPYVGRPVLMTDVCMGVDGAPARAPQADSVWIGAAVPAGSVDLGGGYVRETIRVTRPTPYGDGTVSVTTDDPELRRQILATAEAVDVDDHGCATGARWSDFPAGDLREGKPASLSVCLYDSQGSETTLLWSDRRAATEAVEYADQVEGSSALYDPDRFCTEEPEGQWMAIGVDHADGTTAWTAVVMDCSQILWHYRAQGDPHALAASPLGERTVAPWAVPAVRAYVVGPTGWSEWSGSKGPSVFRGMLG